MKQATRITRFLLAAASSIAFMCIIQGPTAAMAGEMSEPTATVVSMETGTPAAPMTEGTATTAAAPQPTYGSMTDTRDNKTYKTVVIGTQTWMAENLNFTAKKGSYAYNNEDKYTDTYGRMYYWRYAMDDAKSSNAVPSKVQGVCPAGWHLPSDAEFDLLVKYLGGAATAGGKMKETGTAHWTAPNAGADNSSGFTALPAGFSNYSFNGLGTAACFWTSTEDGKKMATVYILNEKGANIDRYNFSKNGIYSVRCVKD